MVLGDISILSNKYVEMIMNSKFFEVWKTIAIAVGIFVVLLVLKNIFTKYIIKILENLFKGFKIKSATVILEAFEKPIRMSFIIVGIYVFASMLNNAFEWNINGIINKLLGTSIIILFTLGLANIAGNSTEFLSRASTKYDIKVNTVLIPILSKTIRFLIIAFAIIQIANLWGLDVNGFVTGIGLGGVVVALAAKDFAANMMSGVIIFMDNPFTIGDWIKCNDLEGIVEDISFRSTKIRTFDKVLISVPNSVLANDPVYNYNKRNLRRVTMDIGVTYNTNSQQLKVCCDRIRDILYKSDGVDRDGIAVNFDKLAESSLNISMYFFINKISFAEYMEVKENINYQIMKILHEENVEVAFPSQTIYMEKTIQE